MGASTSDLRLRARSHHLRLRAFATHAHGAGSVRGASRRVSIMPTSRFPSTAASPSQLATVPATSATSVCPCRMPQAISQRGWRSSWATAGIRSSAQQQPADRQDGDRLRTRYCRHAPDAHIRAEHPGGLPGDDGGGATTHRVNCIRAHSKVAAPVRARITAAGSIWECHMSCRASRALELNWRRHITTSTPAVVMNSTCGPTNQPR